MRWNQMMLLQLPPIHEREDMTMKKTYFNIYKTKENEKWDKVGVGFVNRDGSYNLRLRETISPQDKLQMRQPRVKEQAKEQAAGAAIA